MRMPDSHRNSCRSPTQAIRLCPCSMRWLTAIWAPPLFSTTTFISDGAFQRTVKSLTIGTSVADN